MLIPYFLHKCLRLESPDILCYLLDHKKHEELSKVLICLTILLYIWYSEVSKEISNKHKS